MSENRSTNPFKKVGNFTQRVGLVVKRLLQSWPQHSLVQSRPSSLCVTEAAGGARKCSDTAMLGVRACPPGCVPKPNTGVPSHQHHTPRRGTPIFSELGL